MPKFYLDIRDSAEYTVEANTPEEAIEIALEWWSERTPDVVAVEEPEEEDENEIEYFYDPCIGCPHEGHGSEHCAAVIGDYCRAGHCFIEDEE